MDDVWAHPFSAMAKRHKGLWTAIVQSRRSPCCETVFLSLWTEQPVRSADGLREKPRTKAAEIVRNRSYSFFPVPAASAAKITARSGIYGAARVSPTTPRKSVVALAWMRASDPTWLTLLDWTSWGRRRRPSPDFRLAPGKRSSRRPRPARLVVVRGRRLPLDRQPARSRVKGAARKRSLLDGEGVASVPS